MSIPGHTFISMDAELGVVCQLLNRASAHYINNTSFKEQWSSEFVKSAFQWTKHVEARLADLKDDAPVGILAFLDRQSSPDQRMSHGDARRTLSGPLLTAEELLHPTESLKKRLIANSSLSGSVAAEILIRPSSETSHRHLDPYLPMDDILISIKSKAVGDILQGTLAHFSALGHHRLGTVSLPEISADTIQYKARARVLLNQMDRPCSSEQEDRLSTLVSNLREYLAASPEEAKEVICHLRHMAAEKATEQHHQQQRHDGLQQPHRVNWDHVSTALGQFS
ncbi:MAG: hypothetical protein BYD32DRAFT_274796 [Podila humilis]|nr:MAG: hypothetical protein BYD32DRAFT_274796 [Podila humilis]